VGVAMWVPEPRPEAEKDVWMVKMEDAEARQDRLSAEALTGGTQDESESPSSY